MSNACDTCFTPSCACTYALQGNFTFTAELIVALIEFVTAVWLSLYMGWAVHALRLLPRFTNTLLACCGRRYKDVWYEDDDCYDNCDTAAAPDAEPPGKVDLEAASGKVCLTDYQHA